MSKDTVYKWINKYNMPEHRIGSLIKFKMKQVDSWIGSGDAANARGKEIKR